MTISESIAKVSEGSATEYMESHGVEVNLDNFGALLTTYLIADQDVVASVLNLSPTGKVDAVTDEEYEELQEGSCGDAVAALQRSLILDGYLTGTADGAYGAGTAAAVRAYQYSLPGPRATAVRRYGSLRWRSCQNVKKRHSIISRRMIWNCSGRGTIE